MTVPVTAPTADARRAAIHRRTLVVVSTAQVFSGFGLAAGITVGALLAAAVWDNTAMAGVPAVVMTLGASGAALLIAGLSQRRGRRIGLALGYITGALGAAGIIVSVWQGWPALVLLSFLIYGAGSAANLQARFTGADLAPPAKRATAMSMVLMATTVGAVLGPLSAAWSGDKAQGLGLNPLLGPFLIAGAAYAVGSLVLAVFLRPDPLLVAREIAAHKAASDTAEGLEASDDDARPRWRGHVAAAIGIMIIAQAVMIAIMTMTPVHLTHHHHSIAAVGAIIAAHVAAMYVPSPLSGWLVDKFGALPVAVLAGLVLVAAGVVAAVADPDVTAGIATALILLGLGWSLGMVSGSAMLTEWAPRAQRPRIQGRSDALTTLAGATGAGLAGVIMGMQGYAAVSLAGAALALLMIPLAVTLRFHGRGRGRGATAEAPATIDAS